MIRKAGLVMMAAAAVLVAKPAQAQEVKASGSEQFPVDAALAKVGKSKWSSKGCSACHTIGKGKMAGPDLNGVFERRTVDWLKSWLKDPPAMLATDETAKAMLKEYNGIKMPNLKLKEEEISALLNYMAQEQKAKK